MLTAAEKSVACGRYLCFVNEKSGQCKVRLGTKMIVLWPGCGPRDRTPALAASVAARVWSWLAWMPRAMQEPS